MQITWYIPLKLLKEQWNLNWQNYKLKVFYYRLSLDKNLERWRKNNNRKKKTSKKSKEKWKKRTHYLKMESWRKIKKWRKSNLMWKIQWILILSIAPKIWINIMIINKGRGLEAMISNACNLMIILMKMSHKLT